MIKFFIRLKYYFFGTPFLYQKDKMKWVRIHFKEF